MGNVPQAQTYEKARDAAYARQITLTGVVKVAQFHALDQADQRTCVDCIGHRWEPGHLRGTWKCVASQEDSLASGTMVDGESGFVQVGWPPASHLYYLNSGY
jgi:hypothetical protein|tara:strand:- start:864 stop:1169 length:306 start_codon:yes stop_codon:yes gene_type:complete